MVNKYLNGLPVFDGHNDTFSELFNTERESPSSFFKGNRKLDIDLPRARRGGLTGGIFSIFVPPSSSSPESDPGYALDQIKTRSEITYSSISTDYARGYTNSILDYIDKMCIQANGQVKIIRKYRDINLILQNDLLAIVLHLEGAEAINKDLTNLKEYYDRGIRSLGPVWSRPNIFGSGTPFKYPQTPDTGPGLTVYGKALIRECNRLGIMIDLSHINLKGFYDTAGLSTAPLVVTHSNVYALCQSCRNLTDEQIKIVGDSNGLIGISFVSENINSNGQPDPDTPLSSIVNHIDYVAQKIGVDHVALGSDYDGAEMPNCIKDVTGIPNLIQALRDKGYGEESLEEIAYRNWFRIFRETWKN